jgi:hypothetical protein
MRKIALVFLVSSILFSCAGIKITKINIDNTDDEEGIRFYRPQPYLFVGIDDYMQKTASIIWLPNTSQEYAIQIKSGFGTVESSITLENDWRLTSLNEKRDPKIAEKVTAVFNALAPFGTATVAIPGAAAVPDTDPFPVGLYCIIFNLSGLVESLVKVKLKGEDG